MTKAVAMTLLLSALALPALGCEGLSLENARIIEAPPGAAVLAAYATFKNNGAQAITINAVDSPLFDSGEFHQMRMADGMMHMEKQDTVIIAPHGSMTLRSGEGHLMLMQPKHRLKRGDSVPVTLHCGAQASTFNFPVQAPQSN